MKQLLLVNRNILKVLKKIRVLFMAADISGDGSLDVKEFLSYSHPEEDPAMRPHVLAQVHKIKHLVSSCPKKIKP